ncbi:MAG TPA: hypothetical protein EYN67_18695 [Flavobacteriales bacterium]|nr:hypothetical protein [Methylococcaceae bacterium]HHZ97517.1 hypothetical protein [Flavobacteriales bacterium]
MRELKFRAFDSRNNEMVYSNGTDCFYVNTKGVLFMYAIPKSESGLETIYHKSYDVDQFTGLTDKNDVDIYEGDIVKSESNKHYWLSVVSTDNGKGGNTNLYAMEFCNNVTSCEFEEVYTYERQNSKRRNDINTRMEIIGNIHQNPELLK